MVCPLLFQAAGNYAYGVCRTAIPSMGAEIYPTIAADSYFYNYHRSDAVQKNFSFDSDDTKVTLIKAPKLGKLVPEEEGRWSFKGKYHYRSEKEDGQDRFVMQVEKDGVKVRIHYLIKLRSDPHSSFGNAPSPDDCGLGRWKISTPSTGDTPALSSALTAASQSLTFADLTGSALGETVGTGPAAQITLDTAAAGHGWYIDYTPYLNEEYLPTSNPNEWIAKPSSEAADKMDMLSVLLHEYGHVLGIDHSVDPHDYMGTTLAPGVRRLPSADELALMAKLASEARAAMKGTGDTPSDPSSPSPTLPLGTTLALVLAGRLRGTRYGAWNIDPSDAKLVPQYDIAANPQLANTGFTSSANDVGQADGWASTGDVRFANGAATLSESPSTQSRLNQVFVLGEHDRFLSYTVAGTVGDQAAGPDDGFEVALLDANSGLSLLGATGLTRSDAFLNRQADDRRKSLRDGTERKASGVSVIANADDRRKSLRDGSRTYLIDLAGIPAGTAVNLSFDLIGFGQGAEASNSQITIRDLRLGVPQTADDVATLAEDRPADIDALANDFNARQPGFAPVVVQGPAHGAVTVNADDRRKSLWDDTIVRDITRQPECAMSEAGSPV